MTNGGWTFRPTEFIHQVEDDLLDLQDQMAVEALQMVQTGSPVMDGTFRFNHRISVGAPDYGYDLDGGNPNLPKGSIDPEAYRREITKLNVRHAPFTEIHVQNNLPYATALEYGHSQQAAEGVYGVASAALREKYSR